MNYRLHLTVLVFLGPFAPTIFYALEQDTPFMCKVARDKENIVVQQSRNSALEPIQKEEEYYQFKCVKALKVAPISPSFYSQELLGRNHHADKMAIGASDDLHGLLIATVSESDTKAVVSFTDTSTQQWKKIVQGRYYYGNLVLHDDYVCGDIGVDINFPQNRKVFAWNKKYDAVTKISRDNFSRVLGVAKDVEGRDVVLCNEENHMPSAFTLRDIKTGSTIQTFDIDDFVNSDEPAYDSGALCTTHDGKLLVVAHGYWQTKIFEAGTNKEVVVKKERPRPISRKIILYEDKNFNPTLIEIGKYCLYIRDAMTGKLNFCLSYNGSHVVSGLTYISTVAYQKMGERNIVVVGSTDGFVRVWDLDCDTPKIISAFRAHDSQAFHLAMRTTPLGFPQLVTVQKDIIKIWDCIQERNYDEQSHEIVSRAGNFPADVATTIMGYLGSPQGLQQKIEPSPVADEDEKQAAELVESPIGDPTKDEGRLQEIPVDNPMPVINHNEIGKEAMRNTWFERNKKWLFYGACGIGGIAGHLWHSRMRR